MSTTQCNHKCFECTYPDCIVDDEITTTERAEISQRDRAYFVGYGEVTKAKKGNRKGSVLR